ncbi:hypothetical protein ASZ90_002763 [hydrocarbon metagenome]|uniref:histidine kinase n=1 Tax=hydrocarbon metagenome TaxID=938273 RepID=A0A0W8G2T7_9ZZZZ
MRLQTKTLALFAVSGVLILTLVGTIQYEVLKSRTFADIDRQISKQLEHLDFALTRFLTDVENDLLILAADARVRTPHDGDFTSFLDADERAFVYRIGPREQDIIDLFQSFRHYHPHVNSVYMGRENGSFVRSHKRSSPTPYDPRTRPWYQLAKDHPDAARRTPPYRSLTTPDVNIGVVVPMRDAEGKLFGVLGADITLANLTEYLTDFSISHGGQALLLDSEGIVLAGQDSSLLFQNVQDIFPDGVRLLLTGGGGHVVFEEASGRRHAYVHVSPETGWTLVALVDERIIQKDIRTVVVRSLIILAATIGLLSLVTLLGLYSSILSPLAALTKGTRHIRETGDLNYRLQVRRRDEIHDLGQAFNQMLESMQLAEARLKESHEALQKERDLLEDRVRTRTAELEEANASLLTEIEVRKKAEEAAEEASRTKSLFLANMSHEIRTPLNAILGFTQLLLRDPQMRPGQRRSVDTVYRSGEHLLLLLNSILEMSKIEAGRMTLQEESFDLHAMLDDLEAMFLVLTRNKGISLEFAVDREVPRWIVADEQKVHQVLNNLLGNAVKFTDQGGVVLRAGMLPGEDAAGPGRAGDGKPRQVLSFEVEDTGPGIPAEAIHTVFSHFEQLDPGKRKKGGTGLGLAIAKAYVEFMGGSIAIQSQPGTGSVFRFTVPMVPGTPGQDRPGGRLHRVSRLRPGQGERRVLVVDDNETNREILVRLLEDAGFAVREAGDGRDACRVYGQWHPHLVLLDMIMPEMDGFAVLGHIRDMDGPGAPPVIAVTASVLMEEKERVLACGAAAFLKKPFKVEDLFDLIKKHLGVEFLDEESPEPDDTAMPPCGEELDPARISRLPAERVAALREAALSLDVENLREHIAGLGPEHAAVAKGLLTLVEGYRFEKLQELLREGNAS